MFLFICKLSYSKVYTFVKLKNLNKHDFKIFKLVGEKVLWLRAHAVFAEQVSGPSIHVVAPNHL